MNSQWRDNPATEEQKEKLRFFGCTWQGDITVGHAHDAIEECCRQFPHLEEAYLNRAVAYGTPPDSNFGEVTVVQETEAETSPPASLDASISLTSATPEPQETPGSLGKVPSSGPAQAETQAWIERGRILSLLKQRVLKQKSAYSNDPRFPREPRRDDAKYLSWQDPVGREYGYTVDHLHWEQSVEEIKARICAEEARQLPRTDNPSVQKEQEEESDADIEDQIADLQSNNGLVRKLAAWTLGRTKSPHAVRPLIHCLGDDNWEVRMQAAMSLGDLKSQDSIEALIAAANDSEARVRKAAIEALERITHTCAIDVLDRIPATPEQLSELRSYGEDLPSPLTYHTATVLIQERKNLKKQANTPTVAPRDYIIPAREVQDYAQRQASQPWRCTAGAPADGQQVADFLANCPSSEGCYWVPVSRAANLVKHLSGGRLTVGTSRVIANRFETAGYCVEPDARFGGSAYGWNQTLGVFKPCGHDPLNPSHSYLGAANLLRLSVLIAAADGQIDQIELDVFRQVIENQLALSQTDLLRLLVLERLLTQDASSSGKALSTIAKSVPPHKRLLIGRVLVRIAAADRVITTGERRALERVFKALEISYDVLEDLMRDAARQPRQPVVREQNLDAPDNAIAERDSAICPICGRSRSRCCCGASEPTGQKTAPPASERFRLDMRKVLTITNETEEVVGILSVLMQDEDETQACPSPTQAGVATAPEALNTLCEEPVAAGVTQFSGLDPMFQQILERLLARDCWPRSDFDALAREFHLMPLNIQDTLNEWSDEALGDFLLEGEEPVIIRRDLMEKQTG